MVVQYPQDKSFRCPKIDNANMNVFLKCKNHNFNRKLVVMVSAKLSTCSSCNRKLVLKRAVMDLNSKLVWLKQPLKMEQMKLLSKPLNEKL